MGAVWDIFLGRVRSGRSDSSGGGGGSFAYCEESFQFSNSDSVQTSNNQVYAVRVYANATKDVTTLSFKCSSGGTETVTLGIYDEALNLLSSGDIVNPITGLNTVTISTASLVAGNSYWFAIKGSLATSTWFKRTTIVDAEISRSQFFGSEGLPDPLAAFADSVAPFIMACGAE